jgi:hypothetical protein
MQAYEGYLENDRFYPIGNPLGLQGRRRVIVTVLDEPDRAAKEKPQAKAWREFFEAVNENDEPIPQTFDRVNFSREVAL